MLLIRRDCRGCLKGKCGRGDVCSFQVAFKAFLNITPGLSFPPLQQNSTQQSEFILSFDENPLSEFAELPRDAKEGGLWFSNVLCGVLRGALEMVSKSLRSRLLQVQMQVEARFLSDDMRGDEATEMHVRLIRMLEEEQPENDE